MKTKIVWFLLFTLVASVLPGFAHASECELSDGFRTLQAMIPDVVGDCVGDEFRDPVTDDALQLTTKGLLHWRRGDGALLFTDGHQTWVFGRYGLQVRLNSERFDWEQDSPPRSEPVTLTSSIAVSRSDVE